MSALPPGLKDADLAPIFDGSGKSPTRAGKIESPTLLKKILACEPSSEDEELEAARRIWREPERVTSCR